MNTRLLVFLLVGTILLAGGYFYMTNLQNRMNEDGDNFNDEPKVQSRKHGKKSSSSQSSSKKQHKEPTEAIKKAHSSEPKCTEKTVTVRKFITPVVQPYDLEKCKQWITTYPYGGGPHNCCGDLWNENIRFKRDRVTTGGRVVEIGTYVFVDLAICSTYWNSLCYYLLFDTLHAIGGNTGNDAVNGIIEIYKPKSYDIVEPVPSFVKIIRERFAKHPNIELHAHQFGIGTKNKQLKTQNSRTLK